MAQKENIPEASKPALLPAYLVVGEDKMKQQAVLKRLRARLDGEGALDFNHDVFNAETAEAGVGGLVAQACNTVPFASSFRLVEVLNAEKLPKADSEAVVAYLADPNPTTILCVVAEKLAKNTRLYKALAAVGKQAVIDCTPRARRELPRTVRQMAVGHGVAFTDRSANRLIELVGEDTVLLDAEIRKIAVAHVGNQPVSEAEVDALVVRTAVVKPYLMVDALCERNLAKVLSIRKQLDATPYQLLPQCVRRLRELVCAKSLAARGQAAGLGKELGYPDWRVKNHVSWARRFSNAELRAALLGARDTEQAMKSGADPESAFMDWLLSVAAPAK